MNYFVAISFVSYLLHTAIISKDFFFHYFYRNTLPLAKYFPLRNAAVLIYLANFASVFFIFI